MSNKPLPESGENQGPLDLKTGCRWCTLPGSTVRLLVPSREASERLEKTFDIPGRLTFVRSIALQGIGESEVFAQKNFIVEQIKPAALLVVTISILTTRHAWRGGWVAYLCPVGQETSLLEYIYAARDSVVTELRQERTQQESFS